VTTQPPAPLVSPEVHPDRSVTFRLRAPNARSVRLEIEGVEKAAEMVRDGSGVWSVTTAPLDPDFYGYSIVADGVALLDPPNPLLKPNLLGAQSMVHVPGPASLAWEVNDVPHGAVHHHFYKSALIGDQRDFYVYTPPGYDPAARTRYPALYLLHGFSDDASGWISVGQAHVILDNLIARGQAKPMLVVMPLGYGAPEILGQGWHGLHAGLAERNRERFRDALIGEVMPAVEKAYRVLADRTGRAITGLSMGGGEALFTGLNGVDRFAWVGGFSSAMFGDDPGRVFQRFDAQSGGRLSLLWIACGSDDGLIEPNRAFSAWLKQKGVKHTWIESGGAHTWLVWRRYLAEFVPLLFQQ
jgi:enterochelin esterase-like enzyme